MFIKQLSVSVDNPLTTKTRDYCTLRDEDWITTTPTDERLLKHPNNVYNPTYVRERIPSLVYKALKGFNGYEVEKTVGGGLEYSLKVRETIDEFLVYLDNNTDFAPEKSESNADSGYTPLETYCTYMLHIFLNDKKSKLAEEFTFQEVQFTTESDMDGDKESGNGKVSLDDKIGAREVQKHMTLDEVVGEDYRRRFIDCLKRLKAIEDNYFVVKDVRLPIIKYLQFTMATAELSEALDEMNKDVKKSEIGAKEMIKPPFLREPQRFFGDLPYTKVHTTIKNLNSQRGTKMSEFQSALIELTTCCTNLGLKLYFLPEDIVSEEYINKLERIYDAEKNACIIEYDLVPYPLNVDSQNMKTKFVKAEVVKSNTSLTSKIDKVIQRKKLQEIIRTDLTEISVLKDIAIEIAGLTKTKEFKQTSEKNKHEVLVNSDEFQRITQLANGSALVTYFCPRLDKYLYGPLYSQALEIIRKEIKEHSHKIMVETDGEQNRILSNEMLKLQNKLIGDLYKDNKGGIIKTGTDNDGFLTYTKDGVTSYFSVKGEVFYHSNNHTYDKWLLHSSGYLISKTVDIVDKPKERFIVSAGIINYSNLVIKTITGEKVFRGTDDLTIRKLDVDKGRRK